MQPAHRTCEKRLELHLTEVCLPHIAYASYLAHLLTKALRPGVGFFARHGLLLDGQRARGLAGILTLGLGIYSVCWCTFSEAWFLLTQQYPRKLQQLSTCSCMVPSGSPILCHGCFAQSGDDRATYVCPAMPQSPWSAIPIQHEHILQDCV